MVIITKKNIFFIKKPTNITKSFFWKNVYLAFFFKKKKSEARRYKDAKFSVFEKFLRKSEWWAARLGLVLRLQNKEDYNMNI
jgi:hypothetical protein